MKNLKYAVMMILLLGSLCVVFYGCTVDNPTEDFDILLNVETDKTLYNGPITAQPSRKELFTDITLPKARVSKPSSAIRSMPGSVSVADTLIGNMGIIPWEVYQHFLHLKNSGRLVSELIKGSLFNLASNAMTVEYYFSWVPDTADLITEATLVAAVEVAANDSLHVLSDADFDTVVDDDTFLDFLHDSSVLEDTLYLYLKAEGDPSLDVHIPVISIFFPAIAHIRELINPGDLTEYKLQQMQNADVVGLVTNNGDSTVTFDMYLSIVTSGFVSGMPTAADMIGSITIQPDSTANLWSSPFLLADARPKIIAAVEVLFANGQVEVNLFCTSTAPIIVNAQQLEIAIEAEVGVET